VRQAEDLAKDRPSKPRQVRGQEKDADTRVLEQDLAANLKMKVTIDHGADGSGMLTIRYGTLDDLDDLCRILTASGRG
jgi:ParB family transcriptional regulator, chromosome partitioning protein